MDSPISDMMDSPTSAMASPSSSQFPPDCRSLDEFPVKEAQKADIVRVASYHRKDFVLAVTRLDPAETDPHRTSLVAPFPQAPAANLGALERLPLEILCEITRLLDIASVFSLGQVSRRGRQAVAAVPEYKLVAQHALDALRVVHRTGISKTFTVLEMYNTLRTRDCRLCGQFGGFVFLPEMSRCCYHCICKAPELQAISATRYHKYTGITVAKARKLGIPMVHTLVGRYSFDVDGCMRRFRLLAKPRMFHDDPYWQGIENSLMDQDTDNDTYRYMAVTSLPFFDPETLEAQHGVCCTGCHLSFRKGQGLVDGSRSYALWVRVYSHEGFIRHFQWCAEAQALWVSSQEGTVPIKVPIEESEHIRNGGWLKPWDPTQPTQKEMIRANRHPFPLSPPPPPPPH
ncbi:F-box protein, partial [Candidatus Bathyarchaeota archaeon]|nr:F-box protein [Candidatus Bathyarchaeota archaeon]